jgi:5'-3' exonuclease
MKVHVVDGTYELFRHYFAVPKAQDSQGQEIGAVRGVLVSMLALLNDGATHVGVATDHVVESFRNDLYAGYKTSEGVPEDLLTQFQLLEDALSAMGVAVWAMVEYEADDALATAARLCAADAAVEQVLICSPDKDLAQCVSHERVVQLDRRRNLLRDEAGVVEKFGVAPSSIPDYLAVVGDTADGYPGMAGWGPKAAAQVFSQYPHLEDVPKEPRHWHASIRKAMSLSKSLSDHWDDALLFRDLATLRDELALFQNSEELRWRGPTSQFAQWCERLKAPELLRRTIAAAAAR